MTFQFISLPQMQNYYQHHNQKLGIKIDPRIPKGWWSRQLFQLLLVQLPMVSALQRGCFPLSHGHSSWRPVGTNVASTVGQKESQGEGRGWWCRPRMQRQQVEYMRQRWGCGSILLVGGLWVLLCVGERFGGYSLEFLWEKQLRRIAKGRWRGGLWPPKWTWRGQGLHCAYRFCAP